MDLICCLTKYIIIKCLEILCCTLIDAGYICLVLVQQYFASLECDSTETEKITANGTVTATENIACKYVL